MSHWVRQIHAPAWLAWFLANAAGAALGLLLAFAAASLAGADEDREISLFILVSFALCLGAAQWLVMRRYWPAARWWLPVSAAGLLLGVGLIMAAVQLSRMLQAEQALVRLMQGEGGTALTLGTYGAALGMAQWLYLRRWAAQAGWWVLASAGGMAFFGWLVGQAMESIFELVFVGAVPAVFTGLVLAWLVKQQMAMRPAA